MVAVAVLGSPSLTVRAVCVDVTQHSTSGYLSQSSAAACKERWPSWAPRPTNSRNGHCGRKADDDDDDELMLNVLRCQLTY